MYINFLLAKELTAWPNNVAHTNCTWLVSALSKDEADNQQNGTVILDQCDKSNGFPNDKRLHFNGYSEEFLDRLEPNGNLPIDKHIDRYTGRCARRIYKNLYHTHRGLRKLNSAENWSTDIPLKLFTWKRGDEIFDSGLKLNRTSLVYQLVGKCSKTK